MKAKIITIGDEILVGQTVDTNSAHIAKELYQIGIKIGEIVSISDTRPHIEKALDESIDNYDLILLTGGLGPTNDDITKKVLTDYFGDELVIYPHILERIQAFFKQFNKPFLEVNRLQAMLPKKATILENDLGTASGMWFNHKNTDVISLPGVPFEMKGLLAKFIEQLKEKYPVGNFYHKTLQVAGIGESYLADQLQDWEASNLKDGITVSYLPSIGILKLRLTGTLTQKTVIDERMATVTADYPQYVVGGEFDTLEKKTGELLVEKGHTLGTVESCTGGSLAQRLVSVPGSSAFYSGSIISYTNTLKEHLVGVEHDTLVANGAVSEQVVIEMAENGARKLNVDYCISISGIAGPSGGTEEKPVGTVWVAIATPGKTFAKKFNFGHNRTRNIESTVMHSLNFLRLILIEYLQ